MAMGGGGSTYRSADGIWHAAIDIEPDRATGRRRRLTAQGKTKAVANARLRMKLDAYVRKGLTPNSPSPRLMDWLETWYHERAEANLRPNSRRSYENAIVRLSVPSAISSSFSTSSQVSPVPAMVIPASSSG